jgi:adenosine deaminase CECR1
MVGSPSMSLHGWRQLVEWSIEYSCLSDTEKAQAQQILAEELEMFYQWVVDTYGEYAGRLNIHGGPAI